MSAQIPENMLLSDLLKATGYDCPEELQDRTFAEATAGGDVQTNKASTIDVSAYTEPVVIKPDTDYESMQKATVTLSNIPVVPTLEDNKAATIDVSTYTEPVEITPSEGNDGMKKATVTLSNIPGAPTTLYAWKPVGSTDTNRANYTFSVAPNVGDVVIVPNSYQGDHVEASVVLSTDLGNNQITMKNGATTTTLTRKASGDVSLIPESTN